MLLLFLSGGCGRGIKDAKAEDSGTAMPEEGVQAPGADSGKVTLENMKEKPGRTLSAGTRLLFETIDNYLVTNSESDKCSDVLYLAGQTYYVNKLYRNARKEFGKIVEHYPESSLMPDAVRMVAQSYYNTGEYDEATMWFKKLKDVGGGDIDATGADENIAQSIFKRAEQYDKSGEKERAIAQFELVAIEYPKVELAKDALFNAALLSENMKNYSKAILLYSKLVSNYDDPDYDVRGNYRIAKCHERQGSWKEAAQSYIAVLRLEKGKSEMVKSSLFNAGLAYEKAGELELSAAMFEKYGSVFPDEEDAADVLFKAGEIYMKMDNWEAVENVNKRFFQRYGNDRDRVVQALCFSAIATRKQGRIKEAMELFKKTVVKRNEFGDGNKINDYYAAKAQINIGQIRHDEMNEVVLRQPERIYKTLIKQKSEKLDQTLTAYKDVVMFGIFEFTSQAFFSMGNACEDFGIMVAEQERPKNIPRRDFIAFESGIAEVMKLYLGEMSLGYHEKNVSLGIEYNKANSYIDKSTGKLTMLPTIVGRRYSSLVDYITKSEKKNQKSFALIKEKLEILQNVAPFQDKAIEMYKKTLDMSKKYKLRNKYSEFAQSRITKTMFDVGETYSSIIKIALEAEIPAGFTRYERFKYKIELLKNNIVQFENQALNSHVKNIKFSEAYEISDEWVTKSREKIAEILFIDAWCNEVLGNNASRDLPLPEGITEAEEEELMIDMEDLGFKLKDDAFAIYKEIINKREAGITSGRYVDLAYARLFLMYPREFGKVEEKIEKAHIVSGRGWVCTNKNVPEWNTGGFDDSHWHKVRPGVLADDSIEIVGFRDKIPPPMWGGPPTEGYAIGAKTIKYKPAGELFFRRTFDVGGNTEDGFIEIVCPGPFELYINGKQIEVPPDEASKNWFRAKRLDVENGILKTGENVIAVKGASENMLAYGLFLKLIYDKPVRNVYAEFPVSGEKMDISDFRAADFDYPKINNFIMRQ
ncbi:MAG: tetratricopeptide repeat protein [Fibrobacterota bacterium]